MAPDWTVPQPPPTTRPRTRPCGACWSSARPRWPGATPAPSSCRVSRLWALPTSIPDFDAVNARLEPLTGWRVVGVPGLIPDAVSTTISPPALSGDGVDPHSRRSSTIWSSPTCSTISSATCRCSATRLRRLHAARTASAEAVRSISTCWRVYWYTVEFGLIPHQAGLQGLDTACNLGQGGSPARHRGARTSTAAIRSREVMRTALRDRQAAAHLFRARRLPAAVRGGTTSASPRHSPGRRPRPHRRRRASPARD